MRFIYVTTIGEYSDYGVTGAFIDPRKARAQCRGSLSDAYAVGELLIFRPDGDEYERPKKERGTYEITTSQDGEITRVYHASKSTDRYQIIRIVKGKDKFYLWVRAGFRHAESAKRFAENVRAELLMDDLFTKAAETLANEPVESYVVVSDLRFVKQ
jgi:hypothetical protein